MCTKFQLSRTHHSWEKCDKIFNVWKLERKKNEELNKQQQSDSGIHNTSTHCSHVISSNLLGLTVPEKSVTKKFNIWKLERKKNELKGWISSSILISVYTIQLSICPLFMCIPSFNLLGLTVPEKSVTKNFNVWKLERKKNEEIKEWIGTSSLFPVYTIHLPTVHVGTKFQSSRPHYSWEKCDEKFSEWLTHRMTESQWRKDKANPV